MMGRSGTRLRDFFARWTGTRTFVVTAAIIFFLLGATGALHVTAAFVSFLSLAGVAVARAIAMGETAPIRIQSRHDDRERPVLGLAPSLALIDRLPDPLFVLDGTGRVVTANAAAMPLLGRAPAGKHVATVLRSAPLIAAIESVIAGGPDRTVEYSLPVPVERHFSAFIAPIEAAREQQADTKRDGAPPRLILVALRDLTDAHRVETMRADFVAFASHELKTPLASLSGFIDTLRGHAKDDPQAREKFLEIMADQALRMRRLIEDLLSLSRIELREHVRPSDAVDLLGVVSDVTDGLTPLAEQYGVELAVTAPAGLPRVRGDREELAQVVQNLADNALRYGRSGKRIEIALTPDEKGGRPVVRLSVRDFGPGIAK
jgi:two-component system phosphate regulon sensor histidine kinase PhoR